MNQTIKTTFLFILLILGSKLGICQNTISSKGNVITKDAENLMGTISFDPSDEITSIVFEDLNGNKKTFTADDLLGIRLNDGSYFVQQPKIKSGIFVQKLFEGKLSVYKSKNQYILFDYYENLIYLNPNSGESAKRENYNTLFKITSGLCKIEKNFPYRKFKMNDKTLISIFREHHNCDNEKYTTYNKQTIEVDFSAAIGTMFQTSPILESRLRASSNHSISPMIQVGGRFKSSKPQYKKISLDISMLWNQFNSEVIVIEENSTNTISSKEKTKIHALNIPLTVNHSFAQSATLQPYIGLGLMPSVHVGKSENGVVSSLDRSNQYETLSAAEIASVSGFTFSPVLKLGVVINNKIMVESILGHTPNFQRLISYSDSSKFSRQFFTFSLGYKF